MKFGPKQQERLEGWIEDTLRNYNYKPTKLTVVGAGVRYEATAEFTQKNNKNYEKFHKYFMLTLKEIAVTKGKITSTAEIAKLWQESEYYEQAKTGTVISFSNFEQKAEALLSRKPHEDVINFLRNIRGKVTINFDSFYETVLDELNEYYESDEYEDEINYLKRKGQPNEISVNFSYNLDFDKLYETYRYDELYYFDSAEEFIHENEYDLLYIVTRRFPDAIAENVKRIFNDELKTMKNLNNSSEPLTVKLLKLNFSEMSYFTFDVDFSDYLSGNQIEELMAKIESKMKDIQVQLPVEFYDWHYGEDKKVTLTYYYGSYSY